MSSLGHKHDPEDDRITGEVIGLGQKEQGSNPSFNKKHYVFDAEGNKILVGEEDKTFDVQGDSFEKS